MARILNTNVRICLVSLVAGVALALLTGEGFASGFDPGCEVYFDDIAKRRPIDRWCEASGAASPGPHAEQNKAKNDFCAHVGRSVVNLRTSDFLDLETAVDSAGIAFGGRQPDGSYRLPADRSDLTRLIRIDGVDVGEGSFVRYVGFIANARYAPKNSGESVNCNRNRWQYKDIHLELLATNAPAATTGCNPWITAEISPHLRPDRWRVKHLHAVQRNSNPIRVSGHLFFDGSHEACPDSNYRLSIWEIHPVYAIDVCTNFSLPECDIDDEAAWTPLHEWVELPWEWAAED